MSKPQLIGISIVLRDVSYVDTTKRKVLTRQKFRQGLFVPARLLTRSRYLSDLASKEPKLPPSDEPNRARPPQPTTMPYHPSQSSLPDNTIPSSLSPYFRGRHSLVAADMHWGSTNGTANPHIIIGDKLNQGSSKKSISSIEMGSYTRRIARRGI